MFHVERISSSFSALRSSLLPRSSPGPVSISCVTAAAYFLPRFQKPINGMGVFEATTRLAKKTVRRHSTGPSLSFATSPCSLFRKARFLTKEGIILYENGSHVAILNLAEGGSSSPL